MSRPVEPGDRVGRLYDQFAPSLYRYALMILADHGAAADAVQQVFVGMLRARSAIDSDERYLRRAVRNECYSALRRRRRKPEQSDAPLLEAVSPEADNPDDRVAVEQAMRALTPEQRDLVHLKVYEGWTFQEIADFYGESKNTIASRYRYALERMRNKLSWTT
jgi:RNA polymerase sigma-70 factor (ECF subfamily)